MHPSIQPSWPLPTKICLLINREILAIFSPETVHLRPGISNAGCFLSPKTSFYNPEITEYEDSYDGRNREPVTFPAKIPALLVQGAEGIAVGMSTRILPHNLIEVIEAVISCLKGEPFTLFPDFFDRGVCRCIGV